MAIQSQIRWKKGDYIRLGQAVSRFNKIKNEVAKLDKDIVKFLPDTPDYQTLKTQIKTRSELNRVINSLRSFNKENAKLIELEGGERITTWEYNELKNLRRNAQRLIQTRIKELNIPKEGQKFSRAEMGSSELRQLEAQLKNLNKLEMQKGFDFKAIKWRIQNMGSLDFSMRKAIVYRENYIKTMEKYSNLDNYELLMNKLKSFSNPMQFYEFVKNDELAVDLTLQSEQVMKQEAFNSFLERLGILELEDTITNGEM